MKVMDRRKRLRIINDHSVVLLQIEAGVDVDDVCYVSLLRQPALLGLFRGLWLG